MSFPVIDSRLGAMLFSSALFLLALMALGVSPSVAAQMSRSLSYCCQDNTGQRVCGDRPSYCWGREYEIVNDKGIRLQTVSRPKTRDEIELQKKAEDEAKMVEKKRAEDEFRFTHLLSLYGSSENIDKEIERQKNESEENRKIAESRLKTAKENVELFKAQKGSAMTDADKKTLVDYEKTVTAIDNEIKERRDQFIRNQERLLADKQRIITYQGEQKDSAQRTATKPKP